MKILTANLSALVLGIVATTVLASSHDSVQDPGDVQIALDCILSGDQQGWDNDGRLLFRCKVDEERVTVRGNYYDLVRTLTVEQARACYEENHPPLIPLHIHP